MKKILALVLTLILVLGLCPMQAAVVSAADDENVALGKVPTCLVDREGNDLTKLTDGNPLSIWSGPSGIDHNWVMIDLGEPHVISQVILHIRVDVNVDYYREAADLELSNTPDFAQKVVYEAFPKIDPETGEPYVINVKDKKAYRYVRVIKTNTVTLTFNEFEIYGSVPSDELQIGEDVEGTSLEGAVTLLSHLGLMGMKYPDDTLFGKDAILTRGEAAEAVVDAFAGNVSFSGGIPFNDVTGDHANYVDVMTAYHLGYVTGDNDSAYRPDDYVTTTEFLCMTLRAIGYDDVIERVFNNDLTRIFSLVDELELMKGVSIGNYNDPVTRANAAVIFYNALLAPAFSMQGEMDGYLLYDREADLLRREHKLILTKGIVEENRVTTLEGDAKSSKASAKISGKKFSDPEGKLNGFLGKEVIVATEVGSDNIILAWSTMKDEEIIIPAGLLCSDKADIEAGVICAYDADGKEERFDLEEPLRVIKNEVADPYWKEEDLLITNGQLRLLDNDRDGIYEIVFIEEYTLHYLKSGFYNDNEVTFIDASGKPQTILRENLVITTGEGGSASPRKIAAGTVIKLFTSKDGSQNRIVLYDAPIVGILTSVDNAKAAVDNAAYPLSLAYQTGKQTIDATPGEPVSVFVDERGDILWIERDTKAINDGWVIAFSQRTAISSGMLPKVGFKLFTQDSKWVQLYVADKIVVDGVSVSKEDLADLIKADTNDYYTKNLLRYKVDGEGLISHLDTLNETGAEKTKGTSFALGTYVTGGMFTGGSEGFWSGQSMIQPAKKATPIFVLPSKSVSGPTNFYISDGTTTTYYEPYTDAAYDSLYYVRELTNLVQSHKNENQYLQGYMPDSDNYPACFTKVQSQGAISTGGSSEEIIGVSSPNAPFMLVENAVNTITSGGDVAVKVTGRTINSSGLGAETTILVKAGSKMVESGLLFQEKPDCLNDSNLLVEETIKSTITSAKDKARYIADATDIGVGDLLRYETGVETVNAVERYFDYDVENVPEPGEARKDDVWHMSGGNSVQYNVYYRFQIGDIVKVSDSAFTVKTIFGTEEVYPKTAFANVYACEKSGRSTKLVAVSNLGRYEGANAKIMMYSYNGSPKAAVIYPY